MERGFTHDVLKTTLGKFAGLEYWCMADEIGGETGTLHTHVYLASRNPVEFHAIQHNRGYDVSFVRDGRGMGLAARLVSHAKKRVLEMETTLPDIHIYTGNFLNNDPGKNGALYTPHDAICLEGELFPDAINHPHFGKIVLRAGEAYLEQIRFHLMQE